MNAAKIFFPENAIRSALATLALNTTYSVAAVLLGTLVFKEYGFVLFIALPATLGATTVFLHGAAARRGAMQFVALSTLSLFALLLALFILPIEGAGCLIMAAPLWFGCTMVGTLIAYAVHETYWRPRSVGGFPIGALILLAILPALMGAESLSRSNPPLVAVTTSIDIDAPPQTVWKYVIAFPPLPEPSAWPFALGAAYPKSANIIGHGPGAIRCCNFSTGSFIEPITTWQDHELLAFAVLHSPPSMQEWSPYENLHPPHVDGYLLSRRGQFRLTPLPGNRTRLEGTTWYQINMSPNPYWQLWSSAIIHRIHGNVLAHIKNLSEQQPNPLSPTPAPGEKP
jgi:hypothetical protein